MSQEQENGGVTAPTTRVEFALGEEVSNGLFKSSYARSFISCGSKSLLVANDNNTIGSDFAGNNYYSLGQGNMGFVGGEMTPFSQSLIPDVQMSDEEHQRILKVMEDLRRDNQRLSEENTRLKMEKNVRQNSNIEVIDSTCLQNQISTLEWQLQQSTYDRKMCRSVLEQANQFLDRVRKSMLAQSTRQPSSRSCQNCGHVYRSHNSSSNSLRAVPRSRSVHAIPDNSTSAGTERCSPTPSMTASTSSVSCAEPCNSSSSHSSVSSSSSSSTMTSSRSNFARAKSVAQIPSPSSISSNDSGHGSSAGHVTLWRRFKREKAGSVDNGQPAVQDRSKQVAAKKMACKSAQDVNRSQDAESFGRAYRKPKAPPEVDPNEVPPEKLAEEAFRLGRTVQSVLGMREPELSRLGSTRDSRLDASLEYNQISPNGNNLDDEAQLYSLSSNFVNSTALSSALDRSNDNNKTLVPEKHLQHRPSAIFAATSTLKPAARHSADVSSLNYMTAAGGRSIKPPEEKDPKLPSSLANKQLNGYHQQQTTGPLPPPPVVTPVNGLVVNSTTVTRRNKAVDRKELTLKSFKEWALNDTTSSNGAPLVPAAVRPQTASVCSADTESGFSSLSSFQEIGLPNVGNSASSSTCSSSSSSSSVSNNASTPLRSSGCHTEVGLPEVPVGNVRHRHWSSTPAECQNIFKRHSGSFAAGNRSTGESMSIWV
ncbi:chitinase-like protein PB1E7.04c [Copidosoma floridanum]|uniref:chitinase-like protein PB1E7.04c n=1 Tax=Copidosoma floridanum TaxID=29053 RepID=UPI0006C96BB9|nr:chitinase-like protein PB1E7.04c [Copidosoma floridanum]